MRLSLTPAGRAALDRADAAYAGWLGQLLDGTGDPEAVLDALELLGSAMTEAEAGQAGSRPCATAGTQTGTEEERAHGHRTADHHDGTAQREGGG